MTLPLILLTKTHQEHKYIMRCIENNVEITLDAKYFFRQDMNKQKVLGQFFSDVRLAHLISTFVDKSHVKSIIDQKFAGFGR